MTCHKVSQPSDAAASGLPSDPRGVSVVERLGGGRPACACRPNWPRGGLPPVGGIACLAHQSADSLCVRRTATRIARCLAIGTCRHGGTGAPPPPALLRKAIARTWTATGIGSLRPPSAGLNPIADELRRDSLLPKRRAPQASTPHADHHGAILKSSFSSGKIPPPRR